MASLTTQRIINDLHHLNDDIKSYNTFIESGTFCGQTIINLIDSFQILHTIELGKNYYDYFNQVKIDRNYTNVKNHFGDTVKVLPEILKSHDEYDNCIFWLDGHFSSWDTAKGEKDVPLIEECCLIDRFYRAEKGVIFIDDFRLFGTNVNEDWTDISIDNILNCFKNFKVTHNFINDDILVLFVQNKI
jgi:hypothetical protein